MLRFILLLASGSVALAQQYTISTVAGGAPPATPVTGSSISIGQPHRVTLDKGGNVYFSSSNSVFKLTAGGVLTLVAGNSRAGFSGDNGPAVSAQLNTPQGLAIDATGNLYIADSANNRIRIVSPAGIINTFAGTGGTSLGGGPGVYNDGGPATSGLLRIPMGVAVDSTGNVYIADTGDNSIRKVTTDGIINTIVGDSFPGFLGDGGNAKAAELHTPSDVFVDSKGNLFIADTANAVIREVTPAGVISTIAGTTAVGFAGDGAVATGAALLAPVSVAVDSTGNFYIVENGDSRIRKVDAAKGNINTIVGDGHDAFGGDNGDPTKAQLNYPTGIALDSAGNLYIADFLNLRIRKVAAGGSISTIAGNGVVSFSGDGGSAVNAQMYGPQGVAADGAGNLYISDTGNNVVRKVTKGGVISTIAGNGTPGSNGDGSAGTSAQLNSPAGLAVDAAGNVYIADSLNAKVRKVSSSGVITAVAGNGTPGFGGDGSSATGAQLNTPLGLAVDTAGNLYIADFSNNRIRMVTPGGTISTVAGNGNTGYSGDGGSATGATLNTPTSVAVDGSGRLYIADSGNNVIRMVSGGTISTIAGNGTAGYSGDGGPALKAQLIHPGAIAVDPAGNILIADGSTVIRQVDTARNIRTVGGIGSLGYSGDGGPALNAQINGPLAVAIDPLGNGYLADTSNNAVRMLQLLGSAVTVTAVVNGASNAAAGQVAPGELVVIYGSGLGPATLTQYKLDANGLVPTSLAGTSVSINGWAAPILYTSANQVAVMVPFGVASAGTNGFSCGSAGPSVCVLYQGRTSASASVGVAASAPGIFTANSSGTGAAAALNVQKGVTVVNDASHPANAGDVVTLYITGAGQTNPAGVDGKLGGDGSAGNPLSLTVLPVQATIGGKAATVNFAGGAPGVVAGITQVNVVVPTGLSAGAVPVVVTVGAGSGQAGVTIYVSGN